jgi:hypothetical protein
MLTSVHLHYNLLTLPTQDEDRSEIGCRPISLMCLKGQNRSITSDVLYENGINPNFFDIFFVIQEFTCRMIESRYWEYWLWVGERSEVMTLPGR